MSAARSPSADDPALQAYLDALLPAGVDELPPPAAAPRRQYWLVSAGGLQLALPASEVDPVAGHEAPPPPDSGSVEVIDLGRVVAGRDRAAATSGRAYLRVAGSSAHVLQVESVQGLIDVEDEAVRWRRTARPRPWLAGMLASPAAAVLSVRGLFQDSAVTGR